MARRTLFPVVVAGEVQARGRLTRLLKSRPAVAFIGVVIILVLVGAGLSGGPGGGGVGPPGGQFPLLDCEPLCNRPAGTGPRPANEVTVAINPKDDKNIVVAANDYGTPNGDAWVGYYWTKDGGKSWNRSLVPGYRPSASPLPQPCAGGQLPGQGLCGFEGAGDPVLAVDKDGNFYLAGIAFKRGGATIGRTSAIFVSKSTDGGVTFAQTAMVMQAVSKVTFHDKEWIAVDPQTGEVYVSWTIFNLLAVSQIAVSKSSDGGRTWSLPTIVSDTRTLELQVQGSQIEVDKNGTVHLAWIDYGTPNRMRYSQSRDHGASWSPVRDIAPVTPISSPQGDTTYRTPTMPDMAIDLTNGTFNNSIYIWWPDESNGDADIFQIYSRDAGGTWSNVSRVNNDPQGNGKSQFFPAVSVAGNGWIVGEFYDRRDDPDNVNLSVYVAISKDGGETYTTQLNLTDMSFDGDAVTGASGQAFIGDYLGIAASSWYAIGAWCDTRGASQGQSSDVYVGKVILDKPPVAAPA